MSKKLDIETRKKIVGDGVKKILDMSDDELIRKYDGKSEDEVQKCFMKSLGVRMIILMMIYLRFLAY